MNELLLRIETLLAGLPAHVLLAIGAGATVLGLVLWLGGTRYSTAITAVLGAVAGSAAGLLVSQWLNLNLWLPLVIGAVVLGGLFVLLRNILVLVLAVLVFSAVSGAGYLAVVLDRAVPPARPEARAEARQAYQYFSGMDLTARQQYLGQISQESQTFTERLRALVAHTWEALGPQGWIVLLAVIAGAVVGILLLWLLAKVVLALAYSLVGTAALLLGVQAGLLAVGIPAVSDLGPRRWLLPIALLVMTVFGWVWQLFYGGPKKKTHEDHKEAAHAE